MTRVARRVLGIWLTAFLLCSLALAQSGDSASAIVPRLVNYSGKAIDSQGKVISGIGGITFSIYKDQDGGAPLWMETQNVTADAKGNYTVQLGAMSAEGLPLGLFTSGEARWLGVRVNNGEEQARILLLSVPYALKAADAETIGGLPPSAFVLAGSPTASAISALGGNNAASATASVHVSANKNASLRSGANATTTGTGNTSYGTGAFSSDTTGSNNSAFGYKALDLNTTGFNNTANGYDALIGNTIGYANTGNGVNALLSNKSGSYNTAIGQSALYSNTTGSRNTASGNDTLFYNSTGNLNTAVGIAAGSALDLTHGTGSGNTFLGASAGMSTGSLSNATAIGANAEVAESNALVLGSIKGVNGATASANVGIGTTTPNQTLEVAGNVSQSTTAGGLVKAMLYVNAQNPPYSIVRCFNSTLSGAAATTPPCGIAFNEESLGQWNFTFNFEVNDRFWAATLGPDADSETIYVSGSGDTLTVWTFSLKDMSGSVEQENQSAFFSLIVF